MKQYETTVILSPELKADEIETVKKDLHAFIEKESGKIITIEDWGAKDIAYPIQKYKTGYYYILRFEIESGAFVDKLEIKYKRDENIIRFLTVALDKYAVEYLDKKKAGIKTNIEEVEEVKE